MAHCEWSSIVGACNLVVRFSEECLLSRTQHMNNIEHEQTGQSSPGPGPYMVFFFRRVPRCDQRSNQSFLQQLVLSHEIDQPLFITALARTFRLSYACWTAIPVLYCLTLL